MKLSVPPKKQNEWRYFVILLAVFGILVLAQNVSAKERERRENARSEHTKASHRSDRHERIERHLKKDRRQLQRKQVRQQRHQSRHYDHDYAWRHEANYYRQSRQYRYGHKHRYPRSNKHYHVYRDDYLGWRYPVSFRWIERDYYQPRIVFLRDHPRFGAVYFNEALGYCYGGWNRCVPVDHHHNHHCPKWHRHVYDFAWYDYGPEVVIRAPEFKLRFDWM